LRPAAGRRARLRAGLRRHQPDRRSLVRRPRSAHRAPGLIAARRMDAWVRFRKNRLALIGLGLVLVLLLTATLAPWLALYDPTRQSLIEKRALPGAKYWLGADEFGRDIFSRVVYGSRVALLVGGLSVLIALIGGLVLGTAAGFTGGWLDSVVMRLVEILLAFPYLLLALAIVAMLGPGVLNTTLAVGIWGVPAATRQGPRSRAARPAAEVRRAPRRAAAGRAPPPRPAQRAAWPGRLRDAVHGQRHPSRGRAVVPRARRPAADRVVGPHGLDGP